jgi:signal transduction histidine kinase
MADDLAHEIKNPLNSMVINLEVIRSRAKKQDVDGVMDRAAVLESEIRRLNGLVDGLLKLLRPDRDVSGELDVDALLAEIAQLVGLQAKLARKQLTVSQIGDNAVVPGKRDAFRFALLNLLLAELDAISPEDGRIAVDGEVRDGAVVITILTEGGSAAEDRRSAALTAATALIDRYGATVSTEEVTAGTPQRLIHVRLPLAGTA